MGNFVRDARIGLRLLKNAPGFTAVAVLTLALGIAANTAIFSVIYATYLAPLPLRDPDRLVMVWSRIQGNRNVTAAGTYLEWKRQATVFEDLNAWAGRRVNLSTGNRPENVTGNVATPGFLAMMGYGYPLTLGRDFLPEEGTVGRDRVVILTHKLWMERFGGDRGIIGRQIRISGTMHTVVGVLGAGAADRQQARLWLPLAFSAEQRNHRFHNLLVMGRLKPGVTLAEANANLSAVAAALARGFPETNQGWGASVEPFRNNFVTQDTKTALWLLTGAVAFVLLIACANVANLLLARGTARRREVAVRASLGASRSDLVRQLVTESVVLAMLGGAMGVALAYTLVHLIVVLMPPYTLPSEVDVRVNLPVLLFTLGACVLSGILFGLAPAWQAAKSNVNDALKEAGRAVGGGRSRVRQGLVAAEFALALTLLTGGGLAIQSLFTLSHLDLGFRTERLLTFSLPVPADRFANSEAIAPFYDRVLERVHAIPGVTSASVSTGLPVSGPSFGMQFSLAGKPVDDPSKRPGAWFNMVSPEYFRTVGMRITRGRAFTEHDRDGALPVAIVNETFVKRYLRGADPLTQRLVIERLIPGATRLGPAVEWQIVGVHRDVRNDGPKDGQFPGIHVPFAQSPWPGAQMAVRTAGEATSVQHSIAAALQSLDPDVPMADVKTMEQMVSEALAPDRFHTALFACFAAVALVLAAVGIYGVMSFVVAQRTHEIGLRMALGAGRGRVLLQVLREGMKTAAIGTLVGSLGAYYVVSAMRSLVYAVDTVAPTAFVAVAVTLLGAALVACVVPARRAASVEPMQALRQE
jgi:putative ABC transport system permease protein